MFFFLIFRVQSPPNAVAKQGVKIIETKEKPKIRDIFLERSNIVVNISVDSNNKRAKKKKKEKKFIDCYILHINRQKYWILLINSIFLKTFA